MQSEFSAYYAPSESQYDLLWKDGLIVLDTNVLLDLYRLPKKATEEFLSVLEAFGDRIWIPFQVGMEFQRNRPTVVLAEQRSTEDAIRLIESSLSTALDEFRKLEIIKRDVGVDVAPIEKHLQAVIEEVHTALAKVASIQLQLSTDDPVRFEIDKLLNNRVGPPPKNQEELELLCAEADSRYQGKIPPGFLDVEKDKNSSDASYHFGSLKYLKKHGDLILWRQVLAHAKEREIKALLFITGDRKSDWWWREQGKTLGPHPELRQEIERVSSVSLFWMYSADQFLDQSQKYTKAKVSPTSVQELQEIQEAQNAPTTPDHLTTFPADAALSQAPSPRLRLISSQAIYKLLKKAFPNTNISTAQSFPKFVVQTDRGRFGVSVVAAAWANHLTITTRLHETIAQGQLAKSQGELDEFRIFVVLSNLPEEAGMMRIQLLRLINQYPIDGIVLGTLEGSGFKQLFKAEPREIE